MFSGKHPRINRAKPILSGMSALMASGLEAVKIADSIEYLPKNGVDRLVDGYAVHVYPDGNPQLTVAARAQTLESGGVSTCTKNTKPAG